MDDPLNRNLANTGEVVRMVQPLSKTHWVTIIMSIYSVDRKPLHFFRTLTSLYRVYYGPSV